MKKSLILFAFISLSFFSYSQNDSLSISEQLAKKWYPYECIKNPGLANEQIASDRVRLSIFDFHKNGSIYITDDRETTADSRLGTWKFNKNDTGSITVMNSKLEFIVKKITTDSLYIIAFEPVKKTSIHIWFATSFPLPNFKTYSNPYDSSEVILDSDVPSTKIKNIDLNKLSKVWYIKSAEMSSENRNEELSPELINSSFEFAKDSIFKLIENDYEDSSEVKQGTWKINSDSTIDININEELINFSVIQLTDTFLYLTGRDREMTIRMTFSNTKNKLQKTE